MKLTYYGQSCFLLEMSGIKLLFDPFITGNPLATHINIETINCDYVILSHAHNDHSLDAFYFLNKCNATLISNWEICSYYNHKHNINKFHPMNIGGSFTFDFGTLTMTYAQHSSSFEDGTYGGNPSGFVVSASSKTIYYSGDTGLFSDMKLIQDRYKPNICILPIGGNFTMNYAEALEASVMLNCEQIIGVHYDTFGYIKIDQQEAIKSFRAQNKSLILLPVGGSQTL